MSFSVRRPATAHLNESRQQSADADELVVQPAVICKRDSGVVVRPWWSQQGHEKRSLNINVLKQITTAVIYSDSGDLSVISI